MEEKNEEIKEIKVEDIKGSDIKMKKTTLWQIVCGIMAVLLVVSVGTYGFRGSSGSTGPVLSAQDAADKAITYINTNLLEAGTTAKVKSIEDSGNLYNVKLDIGGREYDSYITKDGKLLFPSSVNLEVKAEPQQQAQPQEPPKNMQKSDKPKVELFVMSHCPFGTQAEKGILPVVDLLGDKIDFDVKFVNYAMHGEKEVYEELNQYCIETEQTDKYLPYLKCFLEAGDGESCLAKAGIDKSKLETCTESADKKFKITENFKDQSTWSGGRYPPMLMFGAENEEYGVRGSPTLVINGAQVNSARSPAAFLATICGAFNEPPEECDEELSSENPSSGFGYKATAATTPSADAAQCG